MNNDRAKLNSILDQLEEDSRVNYEKTAKLMRIAVKIDDAIKASGMSKQDFALKLGKQKSVITKWLSGTHNFTAETLVEIEEVLDIKLIEDNNATKNVYTIAPRIKKTRTNNRWNDVEACPTFGLAFC